MKIKVEWKRETEGVTEFEVPEAEVLAWLNDPLTGGPEAGTHTEVTPKHALEWLQAGDDEVWTSQIDSDRDTKPTFWGEFELMGLARD